MTMTRKDAGSELEFLETSDEAREAGLRRIKRRHYTGPVELLDPNSTSSSLLLEKFREKLLNDDDFVSRLRDKIAA